MKRSILTLALALAITLAFSFTAVPADAAPTEEDRCKAQVVKTDRKYSMCVAGVAARDLRFGQQTGGQATTINDCDSRRTKAYNKIDSKFPGDDFPGCGLDAASKAARAQAALVSAGLAAAASDITSDNAALCTDAGGTYDAGTDTCTPGYNCTIGAMCSAWAAEYPEILPYYTNNYVGHTAATFGCQSGPWEANISAFTFSTIWEYVAIIEAQLACE